MGERMSLRGSSASAVDTDVRTPTCSRVFEFPAPKYSTYGTAGVRPKIHSVHLIITIVTEVLSWTVVGGFAI